MDQEKELGQKFTFWSLAKFVAPSIFTFVFIAVYQMADGLFIERFVGEMAISAINLYYPVISLFIAIGIMIGTGGNAVIVKKVGEGKRKEAGQTFSRIITFSVLWYSPTRLCDCAERPTATLNICVPITWN